MLFLSLVSKGVRRVKPTLPQVGLTLHGKKKNMRGAFEIKEITFSRTKGFS